MSAADTTLASFLALTQEGIVVLDTLIDLLERELTALTERDLEAINTINKEKQTALLAFDQNNHDRNELLTHHGFENSKSGIEQLHAQATDIKLQENFIQQWHAIEEKLTQTINANKRNEIVLARSKSNVEKLISLLQGQHPQNTLYNARGSKGDYSGQSRLGKA